MTRAPRDSTSLATGFVVGVDGQLLSEPPTGIARYALGLMEATIAASQGQVRFEPVVLKRESRSDPAGRTSAGIEAVTPNVVVRKAIHYGGRLGLRLPIVAAVPEAAVMLYPNYRWYPSRGRPSITFIYDLSFLAGPQWVHPELIRQLTREAPNAIRRSSIVATISETVAAEIRDEYPMAADKVRVFTPGPSPTLRADRPDERLARMGLEPGYVLSVGSIEPRKNTLRLIEAASLGRFPLVLAGRAGWSNTDILSAIERSPWVTQIAGADDEDLAALYHGAAIVALASHYEGFGLPLLEAMSFDTPVACSDIPIFHEAGGDAVAYFDHNDPGEIADTIDAVSRDPRRQAVMAESGRSRLEVFSWHKTGAAFADLLATLVV